MGAAITPAFPALGPTVARPLAQYQGCVATGTWARLVFETRGGDERFDFSCAYPPRLQAQDRKRPANTRRREQQKRKRPWRQKEKQQHAAAPAAKQASLAEATAALPAAAAHCKPGEAYKLLKTASCEAGPGTTHMCILEICMRVYKPLRLVTDVPFITPHLASLSIICTLKL